MSDLSQDLSALRIEREPDRPGTGRWVGWLIVLLLLAGGGFGAWKWFTRERPLEVQAGTTTQRAAGTQAAVLNASGYVVARRRATVSSKITGKVVEVNVEEGRVVTEGQVLARLDDAATKAALALAQTQVEAAKNAVLESDVRLAQLKITLGRVTQLLKDGVATQAEFDAAKADVDSTDARIVALKQQVAVAESQVALQQTDLDNTVVRAPFTGVAISKDAQPGEMVSPISAGGGFTRTGICTIVDMKSLEGEVDVSESYLNRVKAGQDVTSMLNAYPDWEIPSHVIAVVPTADRQKATVLVRIGFKKLDPRILPDMGLKVTFLADAKDQPVTNAQPMVLVPKDAVRTENGQTVVFVIRDGVVSRRTVRLGGTDGDRREVLDGVRVGETVVISPPEILKDGMKVVIKG